MPAKRRNTAEQIPLCIPSDSGPFIAETGGPTIMVGDIVVGSGLFFSTALMFLGNVCSVLLCYVFARQEVNVHLA